jgi:hypothetical protein
MWQTSFKSGPDPAKSAPVPPSRICRIRGSFPGIRWKLPIRFWRVSLEVLLFRVLEILFFRSSNLSRWNRLSTSLYFSGSLSALEKICDCRERSRALLRTDSGSSHGHFVLCSPRTLARSPSTIKESGGIVPLCGSCSGICSCPRIREFTCSIAALKSRRNRRCASRSANSPSSPTISWLQSDR